MEPLAWWRGEKYVYGRTDDHPILVPQIKEIIRIRVPAEPPLGGRKKASSRKRKPMSGSAMTPEPSNPEQGWDAETNGVIQVLSFPDKELVERRSLFLYIRVKIS